MATLQTLDGRPLSWAELEVRAELYYWARECPGNVMGPRLGLTNAPTTYYFPDRVSGQCAVRAHQRCSGNMSRVPGNAQRHDLIPCPCDCHFAELERAS